MRLDFEFAANTVEVSWLHKMSELFQYICSSSGIEGFIRILKVLQLEKKLGELVVAWNIVEIDI